MSEKLKRHTDEVTQPNAPATGTPGRAPASARIAARPQIVFRIESAEAARELAGAFGPRDGNGVSAHADVALDRASGASGAPLPDDTRARFESSLGADLSSVRVHTGADSATAAAAVGAKAYTVGNDIHFGAGQYAPQDPFGLHLLAHEVAHTQQQAGTATGAPQYKLEVSTPGDAAEVEADRAADAMVRGDQTAITASGAPPISRKPDHPAASDVLELPPTVITDQQPEYGGTGNVASIRYVTDDGEGPEAITTPWTGRPQINHTLPRSGSGEDLTSMGTANHAFAAVWTSVQAAWNAVVPQGVRYMQAQQDAQKKGLADFGNEAGELDVSGEELMFSTHTKVADTFGINGDVLAPGKTAFDRSKVSSDLKLDVAAAKKAVADADRSVSDQTTTIETKHLALSNKKIALFQAGLRADKLEEDRKLAPLERRGAALKKSAELCGSLIDAMGSFKKGVDAESLNDGGLKVAKVINTLAWDSKIMQIEQQIAFIKGGVMGLQVQDAKAQIEAAANDVTAATDELKLAISGYDAKVSERAAKHRTLGAKMQAAGLQSGLSKSEADKIAVAISAKPMMELAHSSAEELHNALPSSLPAANPDAERGCGLALNRDELINRYGTLKTAKRITKNAAQKWAKRLAATDRLINSARD